MSMIADLIELAYRRNLVHDVRLEQDGSDAYVLRAWPDPITVFVRPDGRFSRALVDGEQLTLGQVLHNLNRRPCEREQAVTAPSAATRTRARAASSR